MTDAIKTKTSARVNAEAFDSLDEVQSWVLSILLTEGRPAQPRGLNTLEVVSAAFTLRYPRRRCITNPQRRWSIPYALGEFCWHVSASNELSFIEYYAKQWK